MTTIALDTPVVIIPAQEAVTASSFEVLYVEENYGATAEDGSNKGPGLPSTVTVDIEIGVAPGPVSRRRLVAWEGDAYLAVRGTWTDQDLHARIKELLQAGN